MTTGKHPWFLHGMPLPGDGSGVSPLKRSKFKKRGGLVQFQGKKEEINKQNYHPKIVKNCPFRKMSESFITGKRQNLKMSESFRTGKRQNLKMSESLQTGKCQNLKTSESIFCQIRF